MARQPRLVRLFDIRAVIGGVFVVYGVLVTLAGVFASPAMLAQAHGLNIDLWTGLAMLALGLAFLFWQWRRPLVPPAEEAGAPPPRS